MKRDWKNTDAQTPLGAAGVCVQPTQPAWNCRWQAGLALFVMLGLGSSQACAEFSVLKVRAREAVQDNNGERIFLNGALEIRESDWQIDADSGVISGPPEQPDRIEFAGEPATIRVLRTNKQPLTGSGQALVFDPDAEIIDISGDAVVSTGTQSINSQTIRYLLESERFSAGRDGGRVRVVTQPDD